MCVYGFPCGTVVKNSPAKSGDAGDMGVVPGKIPWSRKQQPIPLFLPRKFYGQWSLMGYSPWGHKGLDTTE